MKDRGRRLLLRALQVRVLLFFLSLCLWPKVRFALQAARPRIPSCTRQHTPSKRGLIPFTRIFACWPVVLTSCPCFFAAYRGYRDISLGYPSVVLRRDRSLTSYRTTRINRNKFSHQRRGCRLLLISVCRELPSGWLGLQTISSMEGWA
jgi:hypothetical protein